jgi:hypothetical protein
MKCLIFAQSWRYDLVSQWELYRVLFLLLDSIKFQQVTKALRRVMCLSMASCSPFLSRLNGSSLYIHPLADSDQSYMLGP